MKTLETLVMVADSRGWQPSIDWFETTTDTLEVADRINKPHRDDYPVRVNATEYMIHLFSIIQDKELTLDNCLYIHKEIGQVSGMSDLDDLVYPIKGAGSWRTDTVRIGDYVFTDPKYVEGLVTQLFPVRVGDFDLFVGDKTYSSLVGKEFNTIQEQMVHWYKVFETIHPFNDGNGRVGGVLLSMLHYLHDGTYLKFKRYN